LSSKLRFPALFTSISVRVLEPALSYLDELTRLRRRLR
jgi:hypothetical protein